MDLGLIIDFFATLTHFLNLRQRAVHIFQSITIAALDYEFLAKMRDRRDTVVYNKD